MKSILMSIQPKYCELIASGKKTIDVRKTAPKAPFRAFIYQTKKKWIYRLLEWLGLYQQKIIGEFVCDKVDKVINHGCGFSIFNESEAYTNCVAKRSGLDFVDLKKYLETKDGYAWHITDLKVYDEPRELGEFYPINSSLDEFGLYKIPVYAPPQSWQYIELPYWAEEK